MAKRGRPKGSTKKMNIGSHQKNIPMELPDLAAHPEQNKKEVVMPENSEQQINLKKAVSELTKTFGHSIIHFAKDEPTREKIAFPVPAITKMTGGGIQLGSFSVIWGNKSCGKTTLVYYLIGQAQKQGKQCIYLDLENSFDSTWAEKCGVDTNRLLIGHFQNAEEAFDTLIKLSKEKAIDFAVLDSIQSLSPKGEQETKTGKEKSTEDDTMALLARKLSQFFRMSAGGIYKGNVGLLLVGQARTDLGSFIKLETLSGGHALAHWSALTMRVMRGQKADAPRYKFNVEVKGKKKAKEILIGFSLVIRIEKTKISGTAPESTELRIPFYYETAFTEPTEAQIKEIFGEWIQFETESEDD